MLNGGTKIVEPLIYGQNDTVGSYSGYDTISLTPQKASRLLSTIGSSTLLQSQLAVLKKPRTTVSKKSSTLLEAKIMQAEESMREGFNQCSSQTELATAAKTGTVLGNLVEATGTVGGIDRATLVTWWRSYEENTATALTLAQMATAYNSVSVGNDHPDMVLTTQTLFEKYEALLQPQLRYTDTKTADAGFQNLLFKAAPVMYDVHCAIRCNVLFEQQVSHTCWSLR
jgi:hypothetical protein